MELTTRGWAAAGSAAGLYAVGRLLGTVELAMLSAASLLALAAAFVVARLARPSVTARRALRPPRLHAGTAARAEIDVTNRGGRRTSVLAVTDTFAGRRQARFAVPPLPAGATTRAAWRVPTGRRGVYALGPLTVAVTDPLGLVRRVVQRGPRDAVTVFPRVNRVAPLNPAAGSDLVGGSSRHFTQSRTGDQFHGLREYQVGDDLRRVHWRSTARTGELMIREHDVPWQLRATLLLDDRVGVHTGPTFEAAVEATASVATALHEQRAILRLVTAGGHEVPFGAGHEQYEAVMERLAVLGPSMHDRLDAVTARLHRTATGALVVVTGDRPEDELLRLAALGRRYGSLALVRLLPGPGAAVPPFPGTLPVDVPPDRSFAHVWNRVLMGARR